MGPARILLDPSIPRQVPDIVTFSVLEDKGPDSTIPRQVKWQCPILTIVTFSVDGSIIYVDQRFRPGLYNYDVKCVVPSNN